ncbi:hypothetical protein [Actinoplanes subglobosus]|uniref:Uncharacterized protein n=1 Tax=Actinoplanes subglobosus TaxID=1547892 RepID=A0ABV8IZU8_9ACTN
MSTIIRFFVAPDDDTAAAAREHGPGKGADTVTFGNFDVYLALEDWECILTGRDLGDVQGPDVLGDDGPMVLVVPSALTEALAGDVTGVAARWSELQADEGETIDEELAAEIVAGVAALAVRARRIGSGLYCWWC